MSATHGSRQTSLRVQSGHERSLRTRGGRLPQQASSLFVVAFSLTALLAQPHGGALAAEDDLYVTLDYAVDASLRGCWEESELRRSIAHRLGYAPFRDDASIDVRIRIRGSGHALDGEVTWRDASGKGMGERRFLAKDGNCAKLLTEMSFSVSLQIQLLRPKTPAKSGAPPGVAGSSTTSGPTPIAAAVSAPPASATSPSAPSSNAPPSPPRARPAEPPVEPTPSPPDTEEKPEPPDERQPEEPPVEEPETQPDESPSSLSMWVGIGPSLAWRLSPNLTGDGRLFFGIRRDSVSVEIGAEASYPSTIRRWDGSGFRQTLIGGTLALCGHHQSLSACALGRASQVRVTGLGVDEARSPTGFVVQAGLRVAATYDIGGPWSVAAHLDGLGLLTSCTVVLNQTSVWETPRLGALAGVDLSVRFR
jgi:hypothetical protein